MIYGKTQPSNDDKYLWMTNLPETYVRFKVQACEEIQINLLQYVEGTDGGYEILIGGEENQMTSITNKWADGDGSSASTPDILHCEEFRWFWVGIVMALDYTITSYIIIISFII